MILFKKAIPLSRKVQQAQRSGAAIGFVPTMGALHDGHLALLEASKKENDLTVCSIFVNPTQFNNASDYALYPNTIAQDVERLLQAGCSILFLPERSEMYPETYQPPHYDLGYLETVLEGAHRPGHFQGVCQAVDRLLAIINPNNLYMGQKDYQQCLVVKRLLQLTGRTAINLHMVPTHREPGGLARSSRNLRLSPEQRAQAVALYNTLQHLKNGMPATPVAQLEQEGMDFLKSLGFAVDYVEIADTNLNPYTGAASGKAVGLVAASLGNVRLIDNLPLN